MGLPASAFDANGRLIARLRSASGVNRVMTTSFGTQAVSMPGNVLLSDPFDGATIDTTYRWNSPALAGTGAVTQGSGSLTIATGTTASNAAALSSIDKMQPVGAGYIAFGTPVQFEAAPATNRRSLASFTEPRNSL